MLIVDPPISLTMLLLIADRLWNKQIPGEPFSSSSGAVSWKMYSQIDADELVDVFLQFEPKKKIEID